MPRSLPSRRVFALAVPALVAWLMFGLLPPASAAPDFTNLLRNRPYARLFTETPNCQQIRQANELTGAALESRLTELARWYSHFHSEGSNNFLLGNLCKGSSPTTMAAKLAAKGLWASNYRNGSYVSQSNKNSPLNFGEAADLETKAPLSILTWWPGNWQPYTTGNDAATGARLTAAHNASTTTLSVREVGSGRPAGKAATWPWTAGRGTGTTSANTKNYVAWMRVDDEIMQITGAPTASGGVVRIPVKRGIFGTTKASHAKEARAFSPVYIGNTSAVPNDTNLNGSPARNDANYPLRYGVEIERPGGYGWIANRIKATFGAGYQGYNTAWLDVTTCAQYNFADPYGTPVFGWDRTKNIKLQRDRWGEMHLKKLAGLRSLLPGIRFTANNTGFNYNTCNEGLQANYDGAVLEHWMSTDAKWSLDWPGAVAQHIKIQTNNWPGIYWVRWDIFGGSPATYKRFAYGSYLLGRRATANRAQYGGPWGLAKPDELQFWNWGAPSTNPATLAAMKVTGKELYRRDFANGFVLVNPSRTAIVHPLGGTYWDVNNKDANGKPKAVTTVTIGAKDAAFLLKG